MKWLAVAALVGGCALAGALKAGDLSERPKQLRDLQNGLQVLMTEIGYLTTPLPRALRAAGESVKGPVSHLWIQAADGLLAGKEQTFAALWERCLRASQPYLVLEPEDWRELELLGTFLGRSDRADQTLKLQVLVNRLSSLEQQALTRKERLVRLYQYLGWAVGLSLALLLL